MRKIRFENISESGYIPAQVEYLDTTSYATSIRKDNLEAKTIEHFMAVLHAFGITNLSIKINKEVPTGDGSASKFCELIRKSGVVEQGELIPEIVVTKPLVLGDESENGKYIRVEPSDVFSIKYTTTYPEPLGKMSYEFNAYEIFKIAEQIERDGAKFYRSAADDITNIGKKKLLVLNIKNW